MRYGFVLEQESCIGCHACTVACKAENDVPLGSFRTWVKWVESGDFPNTERHAAVLRCNHCEDAPCVEICPTVALHKREDGIVDLDRDRCIGCASCMQACPYDALHIDDRHDSHHHGTAAKCHFCAHRLEVGLAPACVSVCPEQAIKVVDLDDEGTKKELAARNAQLRKTDRETKPRTFYTGAHPTTLDPLATAGSRTLSHAEVPDPLPAKGTKEARSFYDTPKTRMWGWKISAYLVTKTVAAGALLAASLGWLVGDSYSMLHGWIAVIFNGITCALLVSDLHRPERFYFLLTKGNPGSWLVRGGWILGAHGLVSLVYALGIFSPWLAIAAVPIALATAVYTAFLFWQARGRELWAEDRILPYLLTAQALLGGATVLWCTVGFTQTMWLIVALAMFVNLVATIAHYFIPPPTPAAKLAHERMKNDFGNGTGIMVLAVSAFFPPLAFLGVWLVDDAYVRAGQEVSLS